MTRAVMRQEEAYWDDQRGWLYAALGASGDMGQVFLDGSLVLAPTGTNVHIPTYTEMAKGAGYLWKHGSFQGGQTQCLVKIEPW